MALLTTFRAILPFSFLQGHRYLYQSKAYIRLLIKTIARPVLRLEFINLLRTYTVGVARSLCRRLLLDIVIVNGKWSIVMALLTTFTQYAPKITKFLKNHAK